MQGEGAEKGAGEAISASCSLCEETFPSRTKMFRHLEEMHGVVDTTRKKIIRVVVCVGWISDELEDVEVRDSTARHEDAPAAGTTQRRVETTLFKTIHSEFGYLALSNDCDPKERIIPKAYGRGSQDRPTAPNALERTAHGLSDAFVLMFDQHPGPEEPWIKKMNAALPDWMSVFSCKVLPGKGEVSAHQSCTQRRYEYILPLSSFLPKTEEEFAMVPYNLIEQKVYNEDPKWKKASQHTHQLNDFEKGSDEGSDRIRFFRLLKLVMKRFGGRYLLLHNFLNGGACPEDSSSYRIIDRFFHKDTIKSNEGQEDEEYWIVFSISGDSFLRGQIRRMVALAVALARGWLPQRYFDYALYKVAYTKPVVEDKNNSKSPRKKKKVEKISGAAGIHPDLSGPREIEEGYESIVDLPVMPGSGLYLAECKYAMYESKHVGFFLDPRRSPDKTKSDAERLGQELMQAWKTKITNHIMISKPSKYLQSGEWARKCQIACISMLEKADRANGLLLRDEASLNKGLSTRTGFPQSLDTLQVLAYERVLKLLRDADKSGNWPSTSVSRRHVMKADGLIENGGRGGTFTVGRFPKNLPQPKGNELFPELTEACFELEKVILPNRQPSTTIAINRHAQFKFHRDSGAGSGQTRSAIVALGDFAGGELQCEYDVEDIRYSPFEFDGWSQRHSTLPFQGERYSLVWFTPYGVE